MLIPRDLERLNPLQRAYVDDIRLTNERRKNVFESAIAVERAKLAHDPGDSAAWLKLAKLLYRFEQCEACIEALRDALPRARPHAPLWWHSVLRFMAAGRAEEALAAAADGERLFPADLRFRITRYVAFPAVFDSDESIARWTETLTRGLTALRAGDPVVVAAESQQLVDAIPGSSVFYADYLPRNTREWHELWGGFVHDVLTRGRAESSDPAPALGAAPRSAAPRSDGRIRMAIVSEVLRHHIVGFLFVAWALDLDPDRFELHLYACHDVNDAESEQWAGAASRIVRSDSATVLADELMADRPDVILYLAVGMSNEIMELAAQRLAPVQCAMWGHPVTTGLPTIDYFLSADAVEPPNAAEHYSETLVRLPGMATRFALPRFHQALFVLNRVDLGLDETDMVFACMQAASKFLPAFDEVLIAIARELPNSRFVFALGGQPMGTLLLARIRRVFERNGLDSSRHVIDLPGLNKIEFPNVMTLCDALLDAHGWTAGYTALDAIACGVPIVTLEGEYFRTRQASAMLRLMGETRTIGANTPDCVAIALRLARDPVFAASVRERLLDPAAQRRLCDDRSYLPALEAFLERSVAAIRSAGG